jgi:dynein heavy chain
VANTIIVKCYQQLKTEVDNTIEDFKKECTDNKTSFLNNAPKAVDKGMDNLKAFEKLQEYKGTTAELRSHEEQMKFGLEIFNYEPIAYPELTLVEKEIELLTKVWELKNDWDKQLEAWKDIKFMDLQAEDMANVACDYQDKCKEFLVDKEVKDWGVFAHIKQSVDKFRALMELLGETLLKKSIRDRHWKELRIEVKEDFDEQSEDFNLEKVMSLNLLNHNAMILEIGDNADKQLKIEELL